VQVRISGGGYVLAIVGLPDKAVAESRERVRNALHAIGLADGKRIWSEDTRARFGVPKGFFGAAGSPLVEEGRLLANVGGRMAGIVAFDAKSGKGLWTATDDAASYSSAISATIAGRRSAIFLTRNSLVGLDPATGTVQFQRAWRARQAASVNAATPLVIGDLLFPFPINDRGVWRAISVGDMSHLMRYEEGDTTWLVVVESTRATTDVGVSAPGPVTARADET